MKRCLIACTALLCSMLIFNALHAVSKDAAESYPPDAKQAVVHFGTDATYPPLVMLSNDRQVTGFETELLTALCSNLHWQCTFTHIEWDNLIPALNNGKINAIYGGVAITAVRKEQFLFTEPFLNESLAGLISQDGYIPFTEEGLDSQKIGVQTGTTFASYLTQVYPNVKVKRYVSIQDALLDLSARRIDAVFGDTPVLRYFKHSLPKEKQDLYIVTGIDLTPSNRDFLGNGYGVGFLKTPENDALVEDFNQALAKFKTTPEFQNLKIKFGINE